MQKSKIPEYDSDSLYPNQKRLSSSQFLTYEESPATFYEEYVLGAKRDSSPAMMLGSIFSACYADRTLDYRAMLIEANIRPKRIIEMFGLILSRFPVLKGGHPELPMICEFKGWEFRATLDDYVESSMTVVENKTGQREWTQERVNFSDQITFQAWVHWKLKGTPPKKILLNWWNTANKNPDLRTFKTSRSLSALKNFEKRVEVVIEHLEAGNFSNNLYC